MTGRLPLTGLALAAALLAAAMALAFAAVSSFENSGTLEQRAHAVAATLKCPVCHDLSAADSPAPVAQQMRAQITDELRAGRTPDQIRADFVAAYGEWILLSPPQRGLGLLPWLAPGLLGIAGFALLAVTLRRWSRRHGADPTDAAAPELDAADRLLLDKALAAARGEVD
jgi:cytochrome c-type biogenesis protein CcmH